ncbi:transmembrane protein KIAA1109 homolog isoform X2 [Aplysia californica]|uniref:Transmembrane protein KIAA1109 homolog isoform X2 n=1 Tax=Aplysia californica TaxID=6500 RepID=A0ABM1W1V6_APLCA|nr:transmembrane protein KIAA1109 homolog isoform X2 [Aplysia californica]
MKASNNESIFDRLDNELPQSTVYWMLIAIVAAQAWTIYLTYYNSRVLGLIITAILNKLVKYGHIQLGSFSFSILSGKVMFRDVHLITEDFSVRVEYGWLIFRWWRPYVYKELTEDLSHLKTRMNLSLDGFEFHVYNRSQVYTRLEKLFGMAQEEEEVEEEGEPAVTKKNSLLDVHWRDLVPVTKIEISSGRVIFGNYLMPYSFLFKFDKANMVYTTKPASTVFDLFMHTVKCNMETVRLMLVPSPKYNGPVQDEPPRYMGEGFVVLMSNSVDVYFYIDEPGIVQHEPEQIQMADGEVLVRRTYPCVGVDIKCGKNTDFNYGPWVDRQRELIWKFFYPADYQPVVPTREVEPGEKRQYKTLEVKMTINAISTIDILFTKNAMTQAIHMNAGKGSYVEVTIPWIIEENGYVTKVKGQLMLVDVTTSMSFRSLIECETLEFDLSVGYPREWNACQEWYLDLTACKAVTYLIFDLKPFFSDLIDDWSSKAAPDIYTFIPYTWTLTLIIKQFEILTMANENNWVDTSSQHQENAHVAFCGELLDLCVTFDFSDFMPVKVAVPLVIKGETAYCRLYLPESNTIRHALIAMSENMRVVDKEGNDTGKPFGATDEKQWRNVTLKSNGWVDCWSTPYVFLTITYVYFPMPLLLSQSSVERGAHHSISAPVLEEELLYLNPSRSEDPGCSTDTQQGGGTSGCGSNDGMEAPFDPGNMEPDLIQVELEVAPSVLVLYGSLLRNLLHLKENYLGEYQKATDFKESPSKMKDMEASYVHVEKPDDEEIAFDARKYRPFSVTVSVTLHDIQAHLAKNCSRDNLPCPSAHVERLCFELDKSFKETKLQLLLSPCVLLAKDHLERGSEQEHLRDGHLALSGLQVRGHAMFSLEGLPLESETLEYGWLIEVIVGELTGKLSTPQLQNIAEFLQSFIMTIENAENKLQTTLPFNRCQHMISQEECYDSKKLPFLCPSSEDVKYQMTRVSLDFLNIFLVESGSALNVQVHPVRLAHCNLHGPSTRAGITGMIEKVELKQYVSCTSPGNNLHNWLEAGGLSMGPVMLEAAMALAHPQLYQNQDRFLRLHDNKTKRLWFLWQEADLFSAPPPAVIGKCGCLGGCVFFGKNKNGLTFFKLKRHREGSHVAVPQVCKDGSDPGFGQSLLHAGKLVFETSTMALRMSPTKTPTENNGFSFTRGYMSELASPEGGEENCCMQVRPGEGGITLSDELRPKSTFSDTQTLLPGSKTGEVRRYSKDKLLIRQSSLPSAAEKLPSSQQTAAVGFEMRSGSKKGRRARPPPSGSPASVTRQGRPPYYKPIPSESLDSSSPPSVLGAPLIRPDSKVSMDSVSYFTASEENSDSDGNLTLTPKKDSLPATGFEADEDSYPSTIKRAAPGQPSGLSSVFGKKGLHQSSSSVSSEDSTLSYCSALTDHDSELTGSEVDEEEELLDMINLHSHMDLPITESPLLLSCYSQHLSHYYCQDWASTGPQLAVYSGRGQGLTSVQSEYSLSSAGHSIYSAGAAWTPHFLKVKDGFSVNVMKPRADMKKPSPTSIAADLFNVKATMDREHWQQTHPNADSTSSADNVSKTTAVVQLSGSLDVLVTPLLLEAWQRYVEAVTPTLSKLHPSALIDGLHSQCLDRLKQQNKLKKGKGSEESKEGQEDELQACGDVTPVKTSSLQALFTLPKINICVLQASIVEEVIAFSNLGTASDLTAVSLLAVCIDGIRCQLLSNNHSCKVAIDGAKEPLTRKTSSTPSSSVKFSASAQARAKGEVNPLEPDIEKPKEITREENVGTLHISHIHVQLRRLLKFSNFSEHVLLTAIPEQFSRVQFTLEQQDTTTPVSTQTPSSGMPHPPVGTDNSTLGSGYPGGTMPSPKRRLSRTSSKDRESSEAATPRGGSGSDTSSSWQASAPSIGFIMCECGLEDVSVTAVRRLGYRESGEAQLEEKLGNIDKTVQHMEESTRVKVEGKDAKKEKDEEEDEVGGCEDESKTKSQDGKSSGQRGTGARKEGVVGESEEESSTDEPVPLSSPSGRHTSNSLDSSPWDSDKSVGSNESMEDPPAPLPTPLDGDASNGRLELKTIWFNFASPPPISIHKKVDFTRLDWNLLSTASPAIDAWLNPSDRLMNAVRGLVREYSRRLCCVIACMMIEGLECQGIHVAYKSKFNKLTPLSHTLQEDPSNQLLTVLRKYLHKYGTNPVERAVAAETVPQLITVQKGILALMRQWKNVLYMPNLSEINFKSRRSIRPYNVSFALPQQEAEEVEVVGEEAEDIIIDQFDVVDERMSLLQAEGGITQRSGSVPSINSKRQSISTQGKTDKTDGMDFHSAESNVSGKPRKLSSIFKAKRGVGATDSPLDHSSSNLAPPPIGMILNRNDSNMSFNSLAESVSSNEQPVAPTPPHTPLRHTGPKHSILKNRYKQNEDLYQWMAKQQSGFRMDLEEDPARYIRQNTSESCTGGLGSWSHDDSRTDLSDDHCTMATSIMQLADAQILFKPVLQSLGLHVESVRPSAMMKKFGGHLLLQGHFNTFKILIAESEARPSPQSHHSSKGKGRGKRSILKMQMESAAFQCENFDVNVSLKDVVDFSEGEESSKFPYKFAMHKLEAKPSTLQINLLVNCHAIRQNVDMALLRLAHQVLTMVGNVKETRGELKQKRTEQPPAWVQTHRKQESKDSTSSADTNQSDTSHTERLLGSLSNIMALEKERELVNKQKASQATTTKSVKETMTSQLQPGFTALKGESKPSSSFKPPVSPSLALKSQQTPQVTPKPSATPSEIVHTTPLTTTQGTKLFEGTAVKKTEDKKRPEGLALGSAPGKKSTHLRFAQDAKEECASPKKVTTPHPHSQHSAGAGPDVMTPPHSLNLSDSVVLDLADTSSPIVNEKTIIDEIKESTPQCWRHLYQLLELYATMPEPKTVAMRHSQVAKLPVIEEEEADEGSLKRESRMSDYGSRLSTLIQNRKSSMLHGLRRDSSTGGHETSHLHKKTGGKPVGQESVDSAHSTQNDKVTAAAKEEETIGNDSSLAHQSLIRTRFKQSIYVGESIPLIVYGILKVEKVLVSAELSGLKLEAQTTKVHASGTYKKRVKGFMHRVSSDSSYTAHVGHSMINLREGEPPDWQTVVTINVNKSQALLTTIMRRGKEHNSTLVSIGVIDVDIPQHPVVLHDMMSRSTKRITATLQELRWPMQTTSRMYHSADDENQSASPAGGTTSDLHSRIPYQRLNSVLGGVSKPVPETRTVRKHLHIKAVLQGFVIGASILPSLKAQYKTEAIPITGVLGKKAHFTVMLPSHLLCFKSKVTAAAALADTPIPSSASIELPPIQVIAKVQPGTLSVEHQELDLGEDLELLEGNYLYAVAEVGMLEHSLTTDLLNHLVFVQKVFMKEINEIVQKVSGSSTGPPGMPAHLATQPESVERKPLLYSISVRFKGIQVTATTPTSNAVRFETGAITLDLSNRFHLPKKNDPNKEDSSDEKDEKSNGQKMFIQAVVDMNLALGQLLKNPVFEEAEPEFHTMAFFKTSIKIRNALKHEMIPNLAHDQEALLINLSRPIILAQPLAFDKAVLVWLNYKNAYEYWTEQRMALNKEVLTATRQVMDKLPSISPAATPSITTLFLQLTVDDLGICVPLLASQYQPMPGPGSGFQSPRVTEAEQGSALVLTVESTQISACSCGSLVSKGKFKNFCLRFADDFGSSWDDWKPWPTDYGAVMNQCNVPSGTYEVCSRTINKHETSSGNAKWILNVQYDMKGIEVHLDTNIGKRFTLLGHTLTLLAGESEDTFSDMSHVTKRDELEGMVDDDEDVIDFSSPDTQDNSEEETVPKRRTSLASDILPEEIFADNFDPKERARKIEREMNEQAKVVQELKECGATEATIDTERKKLEDLQALLFQDFRRDFLEMLKRKGDRASLIKDKLGLSTRPSHVRSKSTGGQRLSRSPVERPTSLERQTSLTRRQSEDLSRPTKVSFSGTQLSTYTPPGSPQIVAFEESDSDGDGAEDHIIRNQHRSRSLEAIPSSGSDSQTDESVYLRRPRSSKKISEDTSSITSREQMKVTEPTIDFELDVKVFIDRGNCVLYPKEAKEEEVRKQAKRERQQQAGESSSTTAGNKQKAKREKSGAGISESRKISGAPDLTTVFFIPSVDVKVHYNSKTDPIQYTCPATIVEEPSVTSSSDSERNPHPFVPEILISAPSPTIPHREDSFVDLEAGSPRKSSQAKRASLYAWFSLQTLPEEMIISPTFLDFLEQALEPLPITHSSSPSILKRDMVDSLVNNMDLDASQGSLGQQSVAFFPVDVVVHIKVDPSFIRFNCHPVSRVECLLQVPSLDLFFSTKKSDINESMLADNMQSPKSGKAQNMKSSAANNSACGSSQSTPRTRHTSGMSDSSYHQGSNSGGLSVTGCMSDFSLYIFHPYGMGVARRFGDSPGYRGQGGLGSISENTTNTIHDMGRRDSLSLNLEFIRVNISRTRKLETYSEIGDSPMRGDQQTRSNAVRFSAICDVGTASFKYDMRRLSEILSLPKAWYRRTLARRLFLGDDSMNPHSGDELDPPSPTSSQSSLRPMFMSQNSVSHPSLNVLTPPKQLKKHHRRGSSGDKIRIQLSPEFKSEIATRRASASNQMASDHTSSSHRKKSRALSSPDMQRQKSTAGSGAPAPASVSTSWETLVLFAVNLSQLNLEVNMANVMGNTEWRTKDLKTQGRLSINSSGHKDLNINGGFGKSTFESKGGIVGGTIEVVDLHGFFSVCEDPELGRDPDHQAGLSTALLETKLDYMGSSILMTRLSQLQLVLKDEWHVDANIHNDAPLATNRSAFLFVNGKLSWSHFHLMISRSTTPDLIKIISKLDEFFSQQVMSGRRVFQPTAGTFASAAQGKVPRKISESAVLDELRHHRHWQEALEHLTGYQFSMLPSVVPQEGMVLGGTMTLEGQGLMLASFHGVNFRAKYWALFNIKDPYIHFSTESQNIPEGGTHIVQDLQFVVGQQNKQMGVTPRADALHNHMATICKISRTQHMPPNFTCLHEWFTYAMTSSATDPKVVLEFPSASRGADMEHQRKTSKVKATYYSHETEVIFAFPSLYMNLKTSHFQGEKPPEEGEDRPKVECSFVAEFYDHIYVAMDAEVILFLHDLVSSYIREKDRGSGPRPSSKTGKEMSKSESKLSDPTSALKHDYRSFECKTWQLEPTLRLIHWASTQIDPVGADYVLQKLGFSHARVTIPKWVQRGFMDPLDKVLSVLVDKLITMLRDQQSSVLLDESLDQETGTGDRPVTEK